MLISIDQMPDSSRIWVYQINRKLTPEEASIVSESTQNFLSNWEAHGKELKSAYELKHGQFLVIALDESHSPATGCSIDASVHLVQALENELGVSFMTSSQVAFLLEGKVRLYAFNELKTQVEKQLISPQTQTFDNTVKDLGAYRQRWLTNSGSTWIKRYFK